MTAKTTFGASVLAVMLGGASVLSAGDVTQSGLMTPVVTTDWLAEHLNDPGLVMLHVGPPGSYKEKHIPGARSASLRKLIRVNEAGIRDEMIPLEDLGKALSEVGIDRSSRVVIYFAQNDGMGAWAVARYLLTLEYVGMAGRVAYLDGGLPKWVAEKRSVSTEESPVKPTDLVVSAVDDVLVDAKWLSAHLGKPGIAVVDGRPEEGYSGLAGDWDRLGHIPGAANIPFFTILGGDQPYLLKSREELSEMFKKAGAKTGDTVVVYCGTGLWASLPYLAARYLGYETRLYDGSFQEWSATAKLPVAAGMESGTTGNSR